MCSDPPTILAFDDTALDEVLYGCGEGEPTPADVLEAWRQRTDLSEEWQKAAVAVLLAAPGKSKTLPAAALSAILDRELHAVGDGDDIRPRSLVRLARLCHAGQHQDVAEARYRQALAVAGPQALSPEDREKAWDGLAQLLAEAGRGRTPTMPAGRSGSSASSQTRRRTVSSTFER